jgi:putative glutamine amidotransferase
VRPVIGITGPDRGGFPAWLFTAWAVRRAGGRPVRITPRRGRPAVELDGVIIGGGADVEPSLYVPPDEVAAPEVRAELSGRSARHKLRVLAGYLLAPFIYLLRRIFSVKRAHPVDQARDEIEKALLREALDQGMPVLGICRGAQLMNVVQGGTLHQDTKSFYVESSRPWTVFPRKVAEVAPDTQLARVLGRRRVWVNSLHRQAVDRLGAGVAITAREPNGIVQAIEVAGRPFALGVQWHPEYLPQLAEQRQLFRALLESAVGARQHSRSQAAMAHEHGQRVHEAQSR